MDPRHTDRSSTGRRVRARAVRGRTPVQSTPAASPASVLRADRNLMLLLTIAFLVLVPAFYGAGFTTGADPRSLAQSGLYGFGIGLVIWLAIALSHPWPQYLITTGWLAAHGRVPKATASLCRRPGRSCRSRCQRGGAFTHCTSQDCLAS